MSENLNTKESLEQERDLLLSELKDIGVFDPETNRWQAVPMANNDYEADPNDMADRAEDFESRSSILDILQARLQAVNEKLENLK
jgi:RNA polymerase-binding transcription factor DksA